MVFSESHRPEVSERGSGRSVTKGFGRARVYLIQTVYHSTRKREMGVEKQENRGSRVSKMLTDKCTHISPVINIYSTTRWSLRCKKAHHNIHWCAKIKNEVEKLAYQLNEEAERTERPIRRLSKVMYGSTCADMQVDVMGERLSSIKHVVGTTSGCFYPRSNHWEVGGRPQCDKCGCRVRIAHSIVSRLWRQFQTTGTAIRGSVVVVHEEPHPQMTGTLSYRPEETGGRQREKSLDTRHRRLDDRYRVLPCPEDCTVVVCLHDALYDQSRCSLSSDSHRILIWREREAAIIPRTSLKGTGAMGLQFLFLDDNAPCYRTVAAEQLLESEDIERMDWPARSPDLNPIEHVWDFLGRRLAARTLPPVTIRELRLALQDEWAAMPQQLIDPHSQHGQTL
ncbi:transposable element Tcb2 transposase [Trichonephila clavipes]|nr:transposable element Tcb2 transposase [Trichonephila clavipes]